jgi:hypothetical protein
MRNALALIVPALIVSLVLAACGGSGGSNSSTAGSTASEQSSPSSPGDTDASTALSKAEFIKQGDVICAKTDKEQAKSLNVYTTKHQKALTTQAGQVTMVKEAGLPPIRVQTESLAALAPSGDEEAEAIVADMETATKEAEEDPSIVLQSKGNPFNAINKQAEKYGFKACAHAL